MRSLFVKCIIVSGFFLFTELKAQDSSDVLKSLSVEELMEQEVSLASRSPQKLSKSASAIQLITHEDIYRSGATNIPEALRLATNLQVAQINSYAWIISARGFNTTFANKLLVMIDGRTVYTPLFGGVIWELQNVLLEDVDRIEVVSGPGGNLWGPNAVNGIINIITKNSKETQGLYATASVGNLIEQQHAVRYGGRLSQKTSFRTYGMYFKRNNLKDASGEIAHDEWELGQGGFRIDWNNELQDAITVQGDIYGGRRFSLPEGSAIQGGNILSRWSHTFSETSLFDLQLYYDVYDRDDVPSNSSDRLTTFDLDFQHAKSFRRNKIIWGLGYRYVEDFADYRSPTFAILPAKEFMPLFSFFIQDEFKISEDIFLSAGSKFLHNIYTKWEWQPSARISWSKKNTTVWAAASHAVRTPSRFDKGIFIPREPQPPTVQSVAGGPDFTSEKLYAYEAGFRYNSLTKSVIAISTFYNKYTDVYSVETKPGTLTYQIMNGSSATSWGAELTAAQQVSKKWFLKGGYTFLKRKLSTKHPAIFNPEYMGNDARNQLMIHSILDLPHHIQFDVTARYIDQIRKSLATGYVPRYGTADVRMAYSGKRFEVAAIAQNILDKNHVEYGAFKIPRSYYLKLTARL